MDMPVHLRTFVDIQKAVASPLLPSLMDQDTNLFSLIDLKYRLQKISREQALVDRDKDRATRGDPPKWAGNNTIGYAAKSMHLDKM